MLSNGKAEVGRRKAEGKAAVPMVERTKKSALRVMKLVDALPRSRSADVIGRQLLRSATSVGANYRAAQRARTKAEFLAKLGIVEEEADESCYWLELLSDGNVIPSRRLQALQQESHEITAIVVASIRSAKRNLPHRPKSSGTRSAS